MSQLLKKLLIMSLPMATSRLVHAISTFIVMFLIAQIGSQILAASYSIAMTRIVISLTFMSMLFVFGPIISREYAKGINRETSQLQQGWLIALLLSSIPILIFSNLNHILELFHQPPHLQPLISKYFTYYRWAVPAIYLSTINQQFLLGIMHQHKVLVLHIINLLLSTSLNAGLIFGTSLLPQMGIKGAGIAAIVTAWISFLLSSFLIYKNNPLLFKFKKWPNFQWGLKILKIGTPVCFKTANDMFIVFILMMMVGWLGDVSMSASQISNEYVLLILMIIFGIGDANAMIVGHLIKEKQAEKLKLFNQITLILSVSVSFLSIGIFQVFQRPLIQYFISANNVYAAQIFKLTIVLMNLQLIKMILTAIVQTYIGLLRGLYVTTYPLRISILINWSLMLPLAVFLSFQLKIGAIGIVIAGIATEAIQLIYLKKKWHDKLQEKVTLAKPEEVLIDVKEIIKAPKEKIKLLER